MKKAYAFVLFALILLGSQALSEPISDSYGSIQFELPDGFSRIESTDEYKTYSNKNGSKQIRVGEAFSLEQLNIRQFLGSIDNIIDIFVACEQLFYSYDETEEIQRLFVGDLPSLHMHMKTMIDGDENDILFIFNRYDSIAISFNSRDNTELIDYFIENVTAKLSPL